MDDKFKIVIVIFVVIFILYGIHFLVSFIGDKKKKETFINNLMTNDDDDVEHYEDVAKPDVPLITSEIKYDQRILILDHIDTLSITDKEVKGKLMEILFSDESLKQVANMTTVQRNKFIDDKYIELKSSSRLLPVPEENETPIKNIIDTKVTTKPDVKPDVKPETKVAMKLPSTIPETTPLTKSEFTANVNADLAKKAQEALSHLQYVETGLNDIQNYAKNFKQTFKQPDVPTIPHVEEKVNFADNFKDFIEGFENVKSYASLY